MKHCFYLLIAAMAVRGQVPSDSVIRAILADRIDTLHQNVGIVVGIVDANGRRFVSYGNFSVKDPRPVGNDTVFEIGSTTKVFTSTILADMVQRGEVSLDDPVAKYLPASTASIPFTFPDATAWVREVVSCSRTRRAAPQAFGPARRYTTF